MKFSRNLSSRRSGFTLVELLVVIAIVVTLAGLILAGVTTALRRAKLLDAKNTCTGLVNGVENFYADHNYLPVNPGTGEVEANTESAEGIYLVEALTRRGSGADINTKGTDYFNAKVTDGGKRGLVLSGANIQGLYDPFGRPYRFIVDADLDNRILEPNGGIEIAAKILVWSTGVDGPGSNQADWVYSWK